MKLIMYKAIPHFLYAAGLSFAIGYGAHSYLKAVIARADADIEIAKYGEKEAAHNAIKALYESTHWTAIVAAANDKAHEAEHRLSLAEARLQKACKGRKC